MAVTNRWTPAEEQYARQLRNKGKSYREIANKLGRTEAGVCQRLNELRGPCGVYSLRRNRMNYSPGEVYHISEVYSNSSNISFLPARFVFVKKMNGVNKRPDLYLFQSSCGCYFITFSLPQIIGSFVIKRVHSKIRERWKKRIPPPYSGESECWKRYFLVLDVGKMREEICQSLIL